jgi:hypothetical protein
MEACSPIVVRHTGSAQDCEYEVAWSNTYLVEMEYTATASRCGNAVYNRHRAPASRHLRLLGAVPNVRAAAFRQSATETYSKDRRSSPPQTTVTLQAAISPTTRARTRSALPGR